MKEAIGPYTQATELLLQAAAANYRERIQHDLAEHDQDTEHDRMQRTLALDPDPAR